MFSASLIVSQSVAVMLFSLFYFVSIIDVVMHSLRALNRSPNFQRSYVTQGLFQNVFFITNTKYNSNELTVASFLIILKIGWLTSRMRSLKKIVFFSAFFWM